jgi:dienelactone hydrolase
MRRLLTLTPLVVMLAARAAAAPCAVEDRTLVDTRRTYGGEPRPVHVRLWYPDACAGKTLERRPARAPLVLLGSGLSGQASSHTILAEALADAGYVVAFVSPLGSAPDVPPRFDADTVRMLAADWGRALDVLAGDPRVDKARVAVVAWSVGTVVHLAVARDRSEVLAGVSLDGGIAYDYGPRLWDDIATTPPRALPYLHLSAGIRGPVPADDTLLQKLGARVVRIEALSHAQFMDVPPAATPDVERGRAAVRREVLAFLGAQLTRR